ncbi:MAG: division/cell wall cluster transcriptional repressor MraZ [Alphaproteobacteria bacterium]|nr:division/cell wall cluster transcriptional repressor MraZ [Alphaproteobacteria bacterium]
MGLFLSTYVNKIDRKGRVSLPAQFRNVLASKSAVENAQTVILFRSPNYACLEGFDIEMLEEIDRRLNNFDLFSSAQDSLATTIFGEAVQASVDTEGRIIIPEILLTHAKISESAAFVGLGRKFQIWNPASLDKRQDDARAIVKKDNLSIPRGAAS